MSPYAQVLAAADPQRVRAAVSSAAASELLAEITAAAETEALYDAGPATVSEADQMMMAEAMVLQAARECEAARSEADAAAADARAAAGTPGAAQAREAAALAANRAVAAARKLSAAVEDAVGAAQVMRRNLIARHGGVQEHADAAGVLAGREFHGQAPR